MTRSFQHKFLRHEFSFFVASYTVFNTYPFKMPSIRVLCESRGWFSDFCEIFTVSSMLITFFCNKCADGKQLQAAVLWVAFYWSENFLKSFGSWVMGRTLQEVDSYSKLQEVLFPLYIFINRLKTYIDQEWYAKIKMKSLQVKAMTSPRDGSYFLLIFVLVWNLV